MNHYPAPCHVQARGPDHHEPDLAHLYRADDLGLVAHVGQLSGERGENEKREDEQGGSQTAEAGFCRFVIINRIDDEQDHCGLVEIVVECVEQLRDEERQKPPAAQQMRGCKHDPPGRNPFLHCCVVLLRQRTRPFGGFCDAPIAARAEW